jgi:hypothetical protein
VKEVKAALGPKAAGNLKVSVLEVSDEEVIDLINRVPTHYAGRKPTNAPFLFREMEIDKYAEEMEQSAREAMAARIQWAQRRAAMLGEGAIDEKPVTTPWQRRVYQRTDIDWDMVRPEGVEFAGETNAAAARRGYAPVRINPETGKPDDVVLHHALDDPRGAVIETWRSSHTRFHNTVSREPNPWRQLRPDWAEAWQREQSAYWRWRTGQYNPAPQPSLRLPGDP